MVHSSEEVEKKKKPLKKKKTGGFQSMNLSRNVFKGVMKMGFKVRIRHVNLTNIIISNFRLISNITSSSCSLDSHTHSTQNNSTLVGWT